MKRGLHMKLNQLRDFTAIAENGSLRAAARSLGQAQPAITRSIQDLEHSLGVQLFVRSARGVKLTPIGESFLVRARKIMGEVRRGREEVAQLQGQLEGTLVAAFSIAGHMAILGPVLRNFRRRYPKVRLRIIEGLLPALETDLIEGDIDFYVGPIEGSSRIADLQISKICDNFRIVVAREGHPLSGARRLEDLRDAEWIATSVLREEQDDMLALFSERGLPPPNLACRCENALSILSVLLNTDMLAMVPQQWLQSDRLRGVLVTVPLVETFPAPPIMLVHGAGLGLTPAADYFAGLVRQAQAAIDAGQ